MERKQEFSEEDKLIIKKAEIRVLQKYQKFSLVFMASSILISILNFRNTKLPYFARIAPPLIILPFIGLFHRNIGMYGVHQDVNNILDLLAGQGEF